MAATTSTERTQSLVHTRILEVGEHLRSEIEKQSEHDKTRALIAIEEIVRREEQAICQSKLDKAKRKWELEKKRTIEELKKHEEQEVLDQKNKLKKQMEIEFEKVKNDITEMHQEDLQRRLGEAKEIAKLEKNNAVECARQEEQTIALEKMQQQLIDFEEEREQDDMKNRQRTHLLLQEQEEEQKLKYAAEKNILQQSLANQYDDKITKMKNEFEAELTASQQVYYDLVLQMNEIKEELRKTIDDRDRWKQAHDKLKIEFSDFIDQFPGFKGDFLIK